MKVYSVFNNETGYSEEFYNLSAAKTAMKQNDAKGIITKIYSNGDWIPCGEISLFSHNKTFVANTRQIRSNY